MVSLQITSDKNDIISVIQEAILAKTKRTEIGLRKTEQQIRQFETKYNISSEQFLASYTAEDLTGGDDDYISWLGEIKLRAALLEELQTLNEIEYIPQRLSI